MSDLKDFDKYWLKKFSKNIVEIAGEKIRDEVFTKTDKFSEETPRDEIFKWTNITLNELESRITDDELKTIMLKCACHQDEEALEPFRELYENSGDIDLVLEKMQNKFENFIKNILKLEDKYTNEIILRNMGFAGVRVGNKIIATKIPKSAYIKQWFEEKDLAKKRALFCHCPRIRDALEDDSKILPKHYCYCGGGYYQHIWEYILQKPVDLEILETVMNGNEVCKFSIHLPE